MGGGVKGAPGGAAAAARGARCTTGRYLAPGGSLLQSTGSDPRTKTQVPKSGLRGDEAAAAAAPAG